MTKIGRTSIANNVSTEQVVFWRIRQTTYANSVTCVDIGTANIRVEASYAVSMAFNPAMAICFAIMLWHPSFEALDSLQHSIAPGELARIEIALEFSLVGYNPAPVNMHMNITVSLPT